MARNKRVEGKNKREIRVRGKRERGDRKGRRNVRDRMRERKKKKENRKIECIRLLIDPSQTEEPEFIILSLLYLS